MEHRCICRCHGDVGSRGVAVTDALEAAVACPECQHYHAPALLGDLDKPIELPDPDAPWTDDTGG